MQYMVINNFLNGSWLEAVRSHIRKYEGNLSREGYDNHKTLRDSLDPRNAETAQVHGRNVLTTLWQKFLWNTEVEERMLETQDGAFVHSCHTRFGRTLLSSYGNNDGYGHHIDIDLDCIVTAVLMLKLTDFPTFTGGDFLLEDKVIPFENNKLIMFPSCTMHGVSPVEMTERDVFENRRFSLQYFISSLTPRTRFPDESNAQ